MSLLTALLMLLVMVALAFCLAGLGVQDALGARNLERGRQMAYVAEGGAASGVARLSDDSAYAGTFTQSFRLSQDSASVTVTNNKTGASSRYASNGARIPPGFAYVYSVCGRRSAGALVRLSATNPFQWAAFGDEFVKMAGGATTDSWNSAEGTYGTTQKASSADVGTNSKEAGAISLSGSKTSVGGAVAVGPGGSPSSVITGGGSYSSSYALTSEVELDAVSVPSLTFSGTPDGNKDQRLAPGYYGDLKMTSKKALTLQKGTYVFDSFTLAGNAQLVLPDAAVEVYVKGALDLSGGSLSSTSTTSKNLLFYVAGSQGVKITGGSVSYGVYAPQAQIKVAGGSHVWGSLVGKGITNTGGAAIHYDRALANVGTAQAVVKTWQRF